MMTEYVYKNEFDQKSNLNENQISIVWHNLRYEFSKRTWLCSKKSNNILNRLNGHFECASLNALMGPSGSGKSTLLNCLSGNDTSGLCEESKIYLRATDNSTKSCFIGQNIQHCIAKRLTVQQILKYAFKFKNGLSHCDKFINNHIDTILKELMLSPKLLNQMFENCSGGEQKRIAIGQELISLQKVPFWFFDEPTSGLDSLAALQMIKCLKSLTLNHRITVIVSIHQPSSEVLNLFDKLYVLAKGGVCMYSGAPKSIKMDMQNLIPFSEQYQPIETLLKLACNGINDKNVRKSAQRTLAKEHDQISSKMHILSQHFRVQQTQHKPFAFTDLALNCRRLFRINFIANIRPFLFCVFLFVANFVLMSTLFAPSPIGNGCLPLENFTISCRDTLDQESHNRENLFCIAYTLLYVGFIITYLSTVTFSDNVKIFRNEYQNSWYSLTVFYFSSIVVNIVEFTIFALLVSILGYFLTIQQITGESVIHWKRFGRYTFLMWLFAFYCQNFGQLFGVLYVDQDNLRIILSIVYYSFTSMANGLYVNLENSTNPLISYGTKLIAMKFISKGILYAVFGLDRCDYESEYSNVLLFFNIHSDDIASYLTWIVANLILFRLVTLVCLFVKFQNVNFSFLKYDKPLLEKFKLIQLDFDKIENEEDKIFKMNFHSKQEQSLNRNSFSNFSANKIILGWRNLSFFKNSLFLQQNVRKDTSSKMLLNNLNGHFCFGTLNALIGPSGAGKTSLLRALNGQYGDRLSKHTRLYLSKYTQIESCFIQQDVTEHLLSGLTVGQALIYAFKLKNIHFMAHNEKGNGIKIDHQQIVRDLLVKLQLEDTINTKVDNCSGGERKRIALALELTSLQMPNLIFVDEPTSGLDSNSAEVVISCLGNLAKTQNVTIISSIHQANTEMLLMFDQLYMLAKGGVCIYSGPPTGVAQYCDALGKSNNHTLIDSVEKMLIYSCRDAEDSTILQMVQIEANNESTFDDQLEHQTNLSHDGIARSNRQRLAFRSIYNLLCRYLIYFKSHHWKEFSLFVMFYCFYGIILKEFFDFKMIHISGCIDLSENLNNTCDLFENVENIILLSENSKYTFFFATLFMLFVFLQTSLNFYYDFVYFKNEHQNGWYSCGTYYLMKCIVEIVFLIPINLAYVYICAHYYEDVSSGIYWKYVFVLSIATVGLQGMAHIFVLITNGLYTQIFLSVTVFLFTILLSNLYIPWSSLNSIYQFVSNFAIVRFCYEALILLQYAFGRCRDNEIQATLYLLQLAEGHFDHCIFMLVFNLILYRVIAFCLLMRKVSTRKNSYKNEKVQCDSNLNHSDVIIAGLSSSFHEFRIKIFN